MDIFKIDNLSFTYHKQSVPTIKNISFSLKQGDFCVICGKSGSGKTTLIKQLKTCFTPSGMQSGSILFKNRELSSVSKKEQAKSIGFVSREDIAVMESGNIINQLAFGPLCMGGDINNVKLRISEISNVLGINDILYKTFSDISGGQKQLVRIASALIMKPDILIIDDPFSSLDPFSSDTLLNILNQINKNFSVTILISTSSLEGIFSYAKNIMFIENGEISESCTPNQLLNFQDLKTKGLYQTLPQIYKFHLSIFPESPPPSSIEQEKRLFNDKFKDKLFKISKVTEYCPDRNKDDVLKIKNVWFRYDKNSPDIFKGLTLSVKRGEIISVLGRNGCGKSTFLNLICNFLKPYKGKVLINNKPAYKYSDSEMFTSLISMIPQSIEIDTGHTNFNLSNGHKRIDFIKNAINNQTRDIILMDEPTSETDPSQKDELYNIIKQAALKGSAVIVVSHDIEFCSRISDKCCMLFDGEIIATDNKNQFFSHNTFYTTVPRLITKDILDNAVTIEEVQKICLENNLI